MSFIVKWGLLSFSLLLIGMLFPNITVNNIYTATLATLAISIINAFVKQDEALKKRFDPNSLTIYIFVLNLLVFLAMARLIQGFDIEGINEGLIGGSLFAAISVFIFK